MKRLLLLLPVIVIIGCGLFGGEDYFPLKVDNVWNYEGQVIATDTITSTTDTIPIKLTNKITAKDADNFYTLTRTVTIDTIVSPTDTTFVKETDDAILSYETKTSTPDTTLLLPLKENKTWTSRVGTDTIVYTVMVKEDVTVPVKTYKNCWKVKMVENGGTPVYLWYADGTGMVQMKVEETGYLFELKLKTVTIK